MLFVAFVLAGNRTLWTEGKSKQPKLTGLTFHYKQTNITDLSSKYIFTRKANFWIKFKQLPFPDYEWFWKRMIVFTEKLWPKKKVDSIGGAVVLFCWLKSAKLIAFGMHYTLHKTFCLAERMWIKWFQQVDKKLTLSTWDYWQGDTSFPMLVVFGRGGSIQPDPFCYTRLLSCCCWRRWWLHLYWLQDSIAWRDDDNQVQRHVCVCENTWNISGKTSLRITRFLFWFCPNHLSPRRR